MDSLPVIKPKEAIRAFLRGGFYIHHQTGSHARLIHETRTELRITVPIHSKDIPKGTLRRIIRQAGLTVEDFLKLLE
jgi:predicted RNA binding protein YcfA (HicA-like mRNA interferase family)